MLLSSHVLDEVAATCDRVIVVNRGRRVAEGPLDELLAQRIRLRSPDPARLLEALQARGLDATPGRAGHGDRRPARTPTPSAGPFATAAPSCTR